MVASAITKSVHPKGATRLLAISTATGVHGVRSLSGTSIHRVREVAGGSRYHILRGEPEIGSRCRKERVCHPKSLRNVKTLNNENRGHLGFSLSAAPI